MQLSLYRYILFLADFARRKFPEEIDSYADYYYWDIDIVDLKQVPHICSRFIISSNTIILHHIGHITITRN